MRKKVYLSLILLLTPFISTLKAEDWQKSGFHEMRLSVGASVTDFITGYELFGNNWGNYYEGDLMGTPTLTLSYSYQLKSWIPIRMIFTYCGRWQST